LKRLAGRDGLPTLDDLLAISPLPPSRYKVCLAQLAHWKIITRERTGVYRLLQPDMSREDISRLSETYRNREEREKERQQQMLNYAESRDCRWKRLLSYFEEEGELTDNRCGICDNCPRLVVNGKVTSRES
jgi:ATP-dependent DNA helicase RecQ